MSGGGRSVAALHDLALALMVGGVAGGAVSALVLFDRAPSRETAGDVGQAIFELMGPIVLALAMVVMGTRVAILHGAGSASSARTASLWLASAVLVLSAIVALWLTPRLAEIWASAPHAADGSGLAGDDRRRFMRLHGIANAAYLSILLMGGAQILLRSGPRARE